MTPSPRTRSHYLSDEPSPSKRFLRTLDHAMRLPLREENAIVLVWRKAVERAIVECLPEEPPR